VTLGKRIAARRKALGWSQNELARRAQINHPTLYKIEADQRLNPSISVIVRIARALGTSSEALYGVEPGEPQLVVETNKTAVVLEIRALGRARSDAARAKAQNFITSALERAGARVREAPLISAEEDAAEGLRGRGDAGVLATGGLALVEELKKVRERLDSLESWRRSQEGRARKRTAR